MSVNDFVILPGSKAGTSVRLKTKTVKELQLEKVQLETENREMEKKLRELQSNMSREKEERKKLGAYHWKSGQAGPLTIQARILAQNNENRKKVSPGKVKLHILKEQVQEPVKEPFKPEIAKGLGHENSELEGMACGPSEIKSGLLEPPSQLTCTSPENQDKGSLLSGAYDEEESAKSFQEALLQGRKGKSDPGEQLCAKEVPSESVGICEVQTSVTVLKEPIHVEFKKDGLSYMEKLLLKKYRRTPVDQIYDSCMKDSRPVQTLSVHQSVTGGEEEDDDDDDDIEDLTVEEVKKYWKSVFRMEEPNTISESAESSLKIEFLDDSHSKDLEESNFLVDTGAVVMNKQAKTEPPEQCESGSVLADQKDTEPDLLPREIGILRENSCHLISTADTSYLLPFPLHRNPLSPKEISQEKLIVCRHLEKNAVQMESIKPKTMRRSLNCCEFSEKIFSPTELMSNKLLETQLQKTSGEPQELGSVCNSQSLVLPVMTKSSPLQDVAKRRQSVSTSYQGFEGFFVVGANPTQGKLEAPSSLGAASSPVDSSIPFPGDGQWVSERSLGEYADDSVVQGVLGSQVNRPANDFKAQNKTSRLMTVWRSCPGPEKYHSLTCEDVTSSSRHLEKICGNTTDFHNTLELKDHDTSDIFGDWDENQMDDEEAILEDKQQVLALQ